MSLYKQLWLAIVFLLALVFLVSVALSSVSAKRYLEQQLAIKNTDNATALAISLTQQDADPVLMELTLAAQFDTGFYELIRLTGPDGEVLLERRDSGAGTRAPAWFTGLLPIEAAPGVATIQRGWSQAGTLEVRSHSRFAYDELWRTTWTQALAFFLTALAAGAAGSLLLRRLLAPLAGVVGQASAIGERRFVNHAAARGIDQHAARLHERQRLAPQQMTGCLAQRHVQAQGVDPRQQRLEGGGALGLVPGAVTRIDEGIMGDHRHAQAARTPCHFAGDRAEPH